MYEIKEKIVGNKRIIFARKREIPKEFGWLVALKEIMKRGYKIKVYYTIRGIKVVEDNLKYWEYDPEMKGMAPVVPDKIEVYKEVIDEVKNHPFKDIRVIKSRKLKLVAEIADKKSLLDPDPVQTLMLWELING